MLLGTPHGRPGPLPHADQPGPERPGLQCQPRSFSVRGKAAAAGQPAFARWELEAAAHHHRFPVSVRCRSGTPAGRGAWQGSGAAPRGLETFPFERWLQTTQTAGPTGEGISGLEALRRTEAWWIHQRKRGPSEDVTWDTSYAGPLKPLLPQRDVSLDTLSALVACKPVGSCSRRKAALAANAVAQALQMGTARDEQAATCPKWQAAPGVSRGAACSASAAGAGLWRAGAN